jgi:Cu+-exporting ATPase
MTTEKEVDVDLICYHCGQPCDEEINFLEEKPFCCFGCKTVFEILNSNNLCEYYNLSEAPGVRLDLSDSSRYQYLDEVEIRKKLLTFESETFSKVIFHIPSIHCISCIWLLEHLHKMDSGIIRSEVNFPKKSVTIDFNPSQVKLSRIAALLDSVGYFPSINLQGEKISHDQSQKTIVVKLAVAGFCFGNVMLFSFPEYLGIDHSDDNLLRIFSWLNWGLSVPVFFFSALDYLKAAWKSFKQRQINIDVPIAAGLIALFFRSSYDIFTATGSGYLDSFTGLVFFLLIGRWFQGKTYESLAFDRDFKSYFPLAVHRKTENDWKPVIIYELRKGDQVRIRNMEIIPADCVLSEQAYIDYSFVTGESKPVKVNVGERIYAGGRLIGQPVEVIIETPTSQSHLTSLWNNEAFRKREESNYQKIIDRSARVFTWIVMGIAVVTAAYWQVVAPKEMWLVLTSVLMVACPCALALAAPFTYGSMLRTFGKNNFYLKNADVIERMAVIDSVVFDKTGTLTHTKKPLVLFHGELSAHEMGYIKTLTGCSTHPLSNLVNQSIRQKNNSSIEDFREFPGQGLEAKVNGRLLRVGSAVFVGFKGLLPTQASCVFVSIDNEIKGYFSIATLLRKNIRQMISHLGQKCTALLSGDNDSDRGAMNELFGNKVLLNFHQTPHDKLDFIRSLQYQGKKVMMLGDGLNDAGAMKQSNVGIAVTDDTGTFTPACDGILQGDRLHQLDEFLTLAKKSSSILKVAFSISFFYNAIALTFAVTGHLTPLTAAILMPISSVSVVGFSTLAVNYVARNLFKTSLS